MKLLKSQTNQLFNLIQSFGSLSPNQFVIYNEELYDGSFELAFKDSDYFFKLSESDSYYNSYNMNFIPGDVTYEVLYQVNDWSNILDYFRIWLRNLVREINEPDLWSRFQSLINDVNYSNSDDNSNLKFTAKEYKELTQKMDLFIGKIEGIDIDKNSQDIIISKLNEITTLALELNKFDWINLFVGTIISIIIQLNVTKENANLLWSFIKQIFNNLVITN